jgi:hypothetical protein
MSIKPWEAIPWLKKKHYAKRKPAISFGYGMYNDKELIGVCTFGPPCRMYNNGDGIFNELKISTYELNRLCVNDELPKNYLSMFVSKCLNLLPKPCCVVSYADDNQGHKGYIYQATNWIYTGLSSSENKIFIGGKLVHRRTLNSNYGTSSVKLLEQQGINVTYEEQEGKHRYFMFCGSKHDRKKMAKDFSLISVPYPKGNNTRYDSSSHISTQTLLF